MPQGEQQASDIVTEQTGKVVHNWVTDTLEVFLASNTYAAASGFTTKAQFTEVVGGAYAAQPQTQTWIRSGPDTTLQGTNVTWGTDPAGPQDIRIAVLNNVTANEVVSIIDLTADGTTPIDNQANAIAVNFASSPTLQVIRT